MEYGTKILPKLKTKDFQTSKCHDQHGIPMNAEKWNAHPFFSNATDFQTCLISSAELNMGLKYCQYQKLKISRVVCATISMVFPWMNRNEMHPFFLNNSDVQTCLTSSAEWNMEPKYCHHQKLNISALVPATLAWHSHEFTGKSVKLQDRYNYSPWCESTESNVDSFIHNWAKKSYVDIRVTMIKIAQPK